MSQQTETKARAYGRTEHLTDSEYYELLAAEKRRTALDILERSTLPVELMDLAAAVAKLETDEEVVDKRTIERFGETLHHRHLPKMDNLGIIEYDSVAHRVKARQ